ncbi:uncharacterized protein CLUP02_18291 [Colletotrichum lupini]|uniref:Uncharacterized protein n=1 Tax=Colletotrichum lupini TaxID=145971 RepID=A0A9Q8WB68_9PEZI|nr:uncharacterized protein CLUP02_18291 [Colletotrichum lupini]UQC76776.1 hypothetical protein CLUP02_18291 [Colletotrichum lupini]
MAGKASSQSCCKEASWWEKDPSLKSEDIRSRTEFLGLLIVLLVHQLANVPGSAAMESSRDFAFRMYGYVHYVCDSGITGVSLNDYWHFQVVTSATSCAPRVCCAMVAYFEMEYIDWLADLLERTVEVVHDAKHPKWYRLNLSWTVEIIFDLLERYIDVIPSLKMFARFLLLHCRRMGRLQTDVRAVVPAVAEAT